MSRRLRQRREAIESKYVAMHSDDGDEADWEDADFDSLAVYREAESTESEVANECRHDFSPTNGDALATITQHGQAG